MHNGHSGPSTTPPAPQSQSWNVGPRKAPGQPMATQIPKQQGPSGPTTTAQASRPGSFGVPEGRRAIGVTLSPAYTPVHREIGPIQESGRDEVRNQPESPKWCTKAMHMEAVSKLSSCLDDLLGEFRSELPRLRLDVATQKAKIDEVSEKQVSYLTRLTALEKMSAEMRPDLRRLQQDATLHKTEIERLSQRSTRDIVRTEILEKGLAEEIEVRTELDSSLNKGLREHVVSELERLQDMVIREMRERMDGQKSLREEVQLQQRALRPLTSHVDELLIELRTELPRLGQESTALKVSMTRINELFQASQARQDTLEGGLSNETSSRIVEDKKMLEGLHERLAKDGDHTAAQLKELHTFLKDLREREDASCLKIEEIHACVSQVRNKTSEAQETVEQLSREVKEAKQQALQQMTEVGRQISELEMGLQGWTQGKVSEVEAAVHNWVESGAISRVNQVEKAVRKEMSERAAAIQQILERTTQNSERWSQLQTKFEEILIALHRTQTNCS